MPVGTKCHYGTPLRVEAYKKSDTLNLTLL